MKKIPMTRNGLNKLKDELQSLKNKERPDVVKAIEEARAHGDLSENAEYHAAREKQSFIEGRIRELEYKISLADIIDIQKFKGSEEIKFGATITILDEETEKQSIYQIVGEEEADIGLGLISISSPLARALIGKKKDASVEVKTPKGEKFYEILKVEYK